MKMFNDATGFKRIFLKVGYTDLRKGIPGLTAMIRESFGCDPYEKNVLFLFCGRRTDRIKANGLNPFRYLEFLLTEMMEHEEDTDYRFIDDLLPWSDSIPDICKMKNKKEHREVSAFFCLGYSWFTVYRNTHKNISVYMIITENVGKMTT